MPANITQSIQVVRGSERGRTSIDWLDSRHSFSFGSHYDPKNTHFGLLLVSNDDTVAPLTGFSTHPHRDMEIVTWVVSGERAQGFAGQSWLHLSWPRPENERRHRHPALRDQRHEGGGRAIRADVGRSGHGENRAWLCAARHQQRAIARRPGAARLGTRSRCGHRHPAGGRCPLGARLQAGERFAFPASPFAHLYAVDGDVTLSNGDSLAEGDAARVTDAGGLFGTAGVNGSEILLWEMTRALAA